LLQLTTDRSKGREVHYTVGRVFVCLSGRVGNNFATSHVIVYLDFDGTK